MNINKESVIEKIKKLLKLGKNTNFKGEADQALAAAMRLAAGIGLSVEDITPDDEENGDKIEEHETEIRKKTFEGWERFLASGLADALGCVSLICRGSYGARFNIVGTKSDVILFNWLFPYIKKQLQNLYRKDIEGFRKVSGYWRRSWFMGAVNRVNTRALEIFNREATPEERQQYALVVLNKKEQAEKIVENMNVKTARPLSDNFSGLFASMGAAAGDKVIMSRPIENQQAELLR